MKLITLLIVISIFQATAVTRAQSVSLKTSAATLEDVFNSLHKQTGYNFVYNSSMLERSAPVTIDIKNKPLGEALNACLADQQLSYVIEDKTVVITEKKPVQATIQAPVPISGVVKDNKGLGLPGVTIRVKGTTQVVTTDVNGAFHLTLPGASQTLVFTFVGYKPQEILTAGRTTFNIVMEDEISGLDEVVVIGYGTVKKRDLTGAVSTVKGDDIAMNPVTNPIEALQGRVSGLDIQRTSGQSGGNPTILLRGNRTLVGFGTSNPLAVTGPLYIIDGIQGSITSLNPDDIESLEVLKDASSIAIYGSQGANGVIIVTTKKAKAGKIQVDVDSYYGINGFASFPKPLQGQAWVQYLNDKYYASNGAYPTSLSQLNLPAYAVNAINSNSYVDWVDETLQRGVQQNHHISIRGGSEKVQGYFSMGYIDEKGIYKFDQTKSYNSRSGVDVIFNKYFKGGMQNTINWRDANAANSRINKSYGVYPIGTPYDADGNVNLYPIGDNATVSPIANYAPGVFVDNSKNLAIALVPYLEITPIHNLTIRSNLSVNLGISRQGTFDNERSYNSASTSTLLKEASYATGLNYGYLWETFATYNFTLAKDHAFTVTGILSDQDSKSETSRIAGQGLDYDAYSFYNLGAANGTITDHSSAFVGSDRLSYAGRLNYSFKGKYLLTLTDRFDGVSQLAKKWSQFPSVALAWRISDENFMQTTKQWLSNLKLRGGYGVAGNANIAPYTSVTNVVSNSISTPVTLGGTATLPIYIPTKSVANPDVTWERSYNTNLGVDASFFNGRIDLTAEAYYTHTDGILYAVPLPSSAGGFDAKNAYTKQSNIGTSTDKGFELTLDTRPIVTKNFRWNSTLTYTRADEKLTSLNLGPSVTAASLTSINLFVGSPIYEIYGYKKLGIWQTSEATQAAQYGAKPGDIKLQTIPVVSASGVSDNGVHTYGPNDRMVIGHTNPNWFGGWQNTFSYKGVDLTVFLTARFGQTISAPILGYYNAVAQPASYNYWTPTNPTNDFPQPYQGSTINTTYAAAMSYVDGSYAKIKNITLGYTLPAKLVSKVGISRLRFYGTAYNPFIWTKNKLLKDVDPETGGSDSFPLYKQLVFGLNLSF